MEVVALSRTEAKGRNGVVDYSQPYAVEVTVRGTEALLCHRYDCEAVEAKGRAKKGSKDKKNDNVESYVYRLDNGECGYPGVNFKAALCEAAKFTQDPRSPRKSARDLFRAGLRVRGFASFGKTTWDFLDKRPVMVQMNRVARVRPAFSAGWELTFTIEVLLPEYITPDVLNEIVVRAGRTIGIGDHRPDFGTFMVTSFTVLAP